jgi:flagellar motor switch protein FliG
MFLYTEEYTAEFDTDTKKVQFMLSFMKGGLPEKFAANFIDKIMNQTITPRNWGTMAALETECEATFRDKNKKSNAENQIALLQQGSKTAEEFFQEFHQLAFIASYTNTHHNDILIKLIQDRVHNHIINSIYCQDPLPTD